MKSRLIVMLTHNDMTVKNAAELFNQCADLPVEYWGFKDVGLQKEDMAKLYKKMKDCNKKTFLEVVTYSEEECMKGAKLAVDLSVDYLMGTIYYESVFKFLAEQKINYLPFCGKVYGSPSVLEGTINDILFDAKKLLDMGVFGIDLLAFRHQQGEELARKFSESISKPVVVAGSINSKSRMEFINEINPWGFTMGSALFTKNFVKNGDFRQNLVAVLQLINELR